MFAVVSDGGRQYRVQPGDTLLVDYREAANPGESVKFDDVLLAGGKSGAKIGLPLISGASVTAEVIEHRLGQKILIGKRRRRKTYQRRAGHRQRYTAIKITTVDVPGVKDE